MKRIYMDNAATTSVRPEVVAAMLPYLNEEYGNPSSLHSSGRRARKAIETARTQVATAIGANPNEIYFTSGGSESDNWAIRCLAGPVGDTKEHIITTCIEHHALLTSCEAMEQQGFSVTYLPVDKDGLVDPDDVRKAIRSDTALISVMTANNEIGTIEPIKEIGKIASDAGVLFHTDAVQAVGAIPVNVDDMGVDMLSLSAHKFYGAKGVGALYVRHGTPIDNLIFGGGQESGLRAGTENVPGIVGMGVAITLAQSELVEYTKRTIFLRDRLIDSLLSTVPNIRLNGHRVNRLPSNVNVSIEGVEGEALQMRLDLAGIEVSTTSACNSSKYSPSHVLLALGLPPEVAHGSIRLSIGRDNTAEDFETVVRVLPILVKQLRDMNPYNISY